MDFPDIGVISISVIENNAGLNSSMWDWEIRYNRGGVSRVFANGSDVDMMTALQQVQVSLLKAQTNINLNRGYIQYGR